MKIDRSYALELAQALEESAASDGTHVGPTDAMAAASALRKVAGRRRLIMSKNTALAGIVVAAVASPAFARFADLDGDGNFDAIDLHTLINHFAETRAQTFSRIVEVEGARFAVEFQYTPNSKADQKVVALVPLDHAATAIARKAGFVSVYAEAENTSPVGMGVGF